jgi:hypothetical protein
MRSRLLALLVLLPACTVGDRYLIAPATLAAVQARPPEARAQLAVPAVRQKGAEAVEVRADAFSLPEAIARPDGQVAIPTRLPSRRLVLGSALVWIGTPLSIAGLCMVIWGQGAVRWSGIALSAAAEPIMIAGTVIWVKAAQARPQEVPRGRADLEYLPAPGGAAP